MIVGAAEEAEAVGQDLQGPLAEHQPVELHPLLENPEDQVLLLDAGVLGEVFLAGLLDQFGHRHPLQFGDVGVARLLDLARSGRGSRRSRRPAVLGGDFLGQREGLFLLQGAQGLVDLGATGSWLPAASCGRASVSTLGTGFRRAFLLGRGSIIALLLKGHCAGTRKAPAAGGMLHG